jgi:hypothetical protein
MSRRKSDPGEGSESPRDNDPTSQRADDPPGWPTHPPRPQEPWDEITFAAEVSRLVRRLEAWEGVDSRHPVQMLEPGSPEIVLTNRKTFRECIRVFMNRPRPGPAIMIAAPPRDGREGLACVEPDYDADKPMTLWLMADLQRQLATAAQRPAIGNLRSLFEQLLDARAWEVVPGTYGFTGTLLQAGRSINKALLMHLDDAAKRLRDSAIDTPVRVVNVADRLTTLDKKPRKRGRERKSLTAAEERAVQLWNARTQLELATFYDLQQKLAEEGYTMTQQEIAKLFDRLRGQKKRGG